MGDILARIAVGPGEARKISPGLGTELIFEYEEAGHIFRVSHDPRETGVFLPLYTRVWNSPEGEPIAADARERILDGLWAVAQNTSATATATARPLPEALLETIDHYTCWIAARWWRPSGYLINITPWIGQLNYMELGRTFQTPFRHTSEGINNVAFIAPPHPLRWTFPDEPMTPESWATIVERLRNPDKWEDLWMGHGKNWQIVVEAEGPTEA